MRAITKRRPRNKCTTSTENRTHNPSLQNSSRINPLSNNKLPHNSSHSQRCKCINILADLSNRTFTKPKRNHANTHLNKPVPFPNFTNKHVIKHSSVITLFLPPKHQIELSQESKNSSFARTWTNVQSSSLFLLYSQPNMARLFNPILLLAINYLPKTLRMHLHSYRKCK